MFNCFNTAHVRVVLQQLTLHINRIAAVYLVVLQWELGISWEYMKSAIRENVAS